MVFICSNFKLETLGPEPIVVASTMSDDEANPWSVRSRSPSPMMQKRVTRSAGLIGFLSAKHTGLAGYSLTNKIHGKLISPGSPGHSLWAFDASANVCDG